VIQIISPHIDDAFLSLGGHILQWTKSGIRVKIFNVFTISNWISPANLSGRDPVPDTQIVTAVRKNEEEALSRMAGFEYENWDFLDSPLRQAFEPSEKAHMIGEITARILERASPEYPIFFPLGFSHGDHILIRDIGNRITTQFESIHFYEDMPHVCWANIDFPDFFKLEAQNKSAVINEIDFSRKVSLLGTYGSQLEQTWLNLMKSYSYNMQHENYFERYWDADKPIDFKASGISYK